MSLIGELEDEVKDAMRAHDNERRDALRLILSSLKSAEKECCARSRTTRSCKCSSVSASTPGGRRGIPQRRS